MQWPVDPQKYVAFLGIMAVMAITPGPANLFSIATGMHRGRAAVIRGVAGMSCATLVWFIGAALGLSALIAAFPQVFHVLALAGAVYVAWLGLGSILSGLRNDPDSETPQTHLERSAFRDGFAVQLSNPKALLFFTAVLPPFVDIARPLPAQLVLFAAATIGMDMVTMTTYGLGGAALAVFMTRPRFRRAFRMLVGGLLILAAVLIALKGLGIGATSGA
ncbi:MAG: lysine transporter LysE [Caulobacter sp.]|nr:lysine transporter LysE [Caulobacter sp.]